jgi:hypothetical protein
LACVDVPESATAPVMSVVFPPLESRSILHA